MITSKSRYIVTTLAVLLLSASSQATDIDAILKKRVQADKLPPTDTAILFHGTTITLYNDGKMDREEHIVRYLRSDNAWDDYGDPHLNYDADRQELDVLISRVHTKDGRKIDTTPNGFNPMVPFGLDLAPDFTHYRQMVVTHLGIEYDAVNELKYVIRDKKPLYPWAWGEVLLGSSEPTLEREVVIKSAANAGLQVKEENGVPPGKGLMNNDQEILTWKLIDLPGLDFAEAGGKSSLYLPRICYSTCPSWESFTKEVGKHFTGAVIQNGALVAALQEYKKIGDDAQRLDSLVTFVKNRIALKSWDDPGLLVTYRDADRVFSTGYGSPADLAVLYAAALQYLGLQAVPYLLTPNLLAVPGLTGREMYSFHIETASLLCRLDPAHHQLNYLPPQGESYIGIQPPQAPKLMPLEDYTENKVQLEIEVHLSADGSATGTILVKTTGQLANLQKARTESATDQLKKWMEDFLTSPEVKDAQVLQQAFDRIELRGEFSGAAMDTISGMIRVMLPANPNNITGLLPSGLLLHRPKRSVPLYLDHAGSLDFNLSLHLPEGWKTVALPPTQEKKTENLTFMRTVATDNKVVRIHESTIFPQLKIPTELWQDFRSIMLQVGKKNDRTLLMKKVG